MEGQSSSGYTLYWLEEQYHTADIIPTNKFNFHSPWTKVETTSFPTLPLGACGLLNTSFHTGAIHSCLDLGKAF